MDDTVIDRFITELPMETRASQFSTSKDSEEERRVLSIYTSPFSDECQAFAQLQSRGENGTWAVKCHGWIKLSDDQYRRISGRHGFPLSRRAIVKDDRPNSVRLSDVPEIVRKKEIARQALMYDSDMLPRNFRGSFLVDLGVRRRTFTLFMVELGFEQDYESHGRWVTQFEIDDETGEVVWGGCAPRRQ